MSVLEKQVSTAQMDLPLVEERFLASGNGTWVERTPTWWLWLRGQWPAESPNGVMD